MNRAEERLRALWAQARDVRQRQSWYFKTRDRNLLPKCREAERDLDRLLEAINTEFKFDTTPREGSMI